MHHIDIRDLQTQVKINKKKIKRCAEVVLKAMGEENSELSLLFVNDSYIRRLNWKYRNVNSKTDVLAFSMREGEKTFLEKGTILGDVVISAETANRVAKSGKGTLQDEICLYLVHGILHLLGYDDKKHSDRKRIRAKEKQLLKAISV